MPNSKLECSDASLDAADLFAEAASMAADRHVKRELLRAGCSVLENALGLNSDAEIADESAMEHSPVESVQARSA